MKKSLVVGMGTWIARRRGRWVGRAEPVPQVAPPARHHQHDQDDPNPAAAEAVSEARVVRIPADHVVRCIREDPDIALAMIASRAGRPARREPTARRTTVDRSRA
mgnify:CR=1 FL=1